MKVLELFSGTASFSNVAKERGHETFTVDIDPSFGPDIVADIGELQVSDLPEDWRHPDVVWASPPCQCFSIMNMNKNFRSEPFHSPKPLRDQTIDAMILTEHTFKLIQDLKPKYYFIENPRAMLRKMPFINGWHKSTITYCKYGFNYQKPTDIWNNCFEWKPRRRCTKKSPCQFKESYGTHFGWWKRVKDQPKGYEHLKRVRPNHPDRSVVPRQLCEEIIIACEGARE